MIDYTDPDDPDNFEPQNFGWPSSGPFSPEELTEVIRLRKLGRGIANLPG
jgi:hypothetical protein